MMASLDLARNTTEYNNTVEAINVITGDKNYQKFLYHQLKDSINRANKIDIIVSFLMESGAKLILNDLKTALNRGVQIRILTSNYLGITQPSALYLVKQELGDKVDLRFYNDKTRSFHPKAYIFNHDNYGEIFIGSSNISRSALTSGVEWNYRLLSNVDSESYGIFIDTFNELFANHSIAIDEKLLKEYSKNWKKPSIAKDLEKFDTGEDNKVRVVFQPRGAQIEALYALHNTREEGATKALVQAATGVGKTYLAAFDSAHYKRVLFVAHREEILNQAAISFKNVRNSDDFGFFRGNIKDVGKSVVFASVATLGKQEYLNSRYFAPNYFDYMVVDEFHHAVNKQYRAIIDYFKPKFMLGLTATPDRLDGRDIFEICDYNVPYEISLRDAINKGMLVPFHYYGIYDDIDYSKLKFNRGKYDENELNDAYIGNEKRYDLIYKHYLKYRSQRALGFCSSKLHAVAMAEAFTKRGIKAVAVYSDSKGEFSEDREIAISKLIKGEIKVIFCVDMFNEGVDIPSVDMVMFLRPTESPIVFLQQLGRGLRLYRGKEHLNVLDFIGNYQKAGRTRFLLKGNNTVSDSGGSGYIRNDEYPDGCIVDFDMNLIDLFAEMDKQRQPIKERIKQEFYKVKDLLDDKIPSRKELFTYMDDSVYEMCLRNSKENLFKNFLEYKKELGLLTSAEERIYGTLAKEFLHLLETTDMVKVYKMPVLKCFYNNGKIREGVTESELLECWKTFFSEGTNWKDLKKGITLDEYKKISDKAHLNNILKNPVKFLKASGKGLFVEKEGYAIALHDDILGYIREEAFISDMKDIIEYRTIDYYRRRYISSEL